MPQCSLNQQKMEFNRRNKTAYRIPAKTFHGPAERQNFLFSFFFNFPENVFYKTDSSVELFIS